MSRIPCIALMRAAPRAPGKQWEDFFTEQVYSGIEYNMLAMDAYAFRFS